MNKDQSDIPKLFRSAEELLVPEITQINGIIPEWLSGTYFKNGPGKFDFDNFTVNHSFDGYCIISKFEIKGDTVKYEKKYLQSEAYKRALAVQKPVITEFGTKAYSDPNKSIFSRMITSLIPELTDNATGGMYTIGNDLYLSCDTGFFHEVDPCSLKCKSRNEAAKLFGVNIMCSHALTDHDGYTYNLGLSLISGLKYNIVKIPPPSKNQTSKEAMKKSKILCTIPSRNITLFSFMHSFGMSKNYIIFIEQPLVGSMTKLLGSVLSKGQCFRDWIEWRPEMKNRFVVVEKATGKVVKTEFLSVQPFLCFHFINCYEEDGQIVVDLFAFPGLSFIDNQYLAKYRAGCKFDTDLSRTERFVLPIKADIKNCPENKNLVSIKTTATAIKKESRIIVSPETLTDVAFELPSFNKKFQGRPYRYFYTTGCFIPNANQNKIYKFDVSIKKLLIWEQCEYYGCGEPFFVRNPQGTAEDDGVLLVSVSDSRDSHNDFLLFLDAKNLQELGRAQFQSNIPIAAHGIFIPSQNNLK